jgi:hypothetical protein
MKRFWFTGLLALGGAWFLTGCDRQSGGAVAESEPAAVPQFSAKKGLLLPEETRRALGMKLVEVTERNLALTLNVELRVYRKEGGSAFASGRIAPEQAKLLKAANTVEIRLPGAGKATGKVTGVHHGLERATGLVEVLVEVAGNADVLAVGAFVQANATIQSGGSVATIPRPALLECSKGHFVYTGGGEGWASVLPSTPQREIGDDSQNRRILPAAAGARAAGNAPPHWRGGGVGAPPAD